MRNPVDRMYEEAARRLMETGYSEQAVAGAHVRPVWEDGTPAMTRYLPQQVFRYEPGLVPLTNYRKTAWKTAIKELLWIYKDKSNDVNLLRDRYHVKYWDSWKNEEGTLGTAYGYQVGKKFLSPETGEETDQISRLIQTLRADPLNRRIMMSLIDMDDLHAMTLIPCAFLTLWTVTEDRLNMTLVQRSGDFLAAASPGGINSFQYYALLCMVARVTGYRPGQFVHFIENLHIYDRHEEIVREVLKAEVEQAPRPRLLLNPSVKEFEDFTIDDFQLEDYRPDGRKYRIPIAL